jgi:hypothetical protein
LQPGDIILISKLAGPTTNASIMEYINTSADRLLKTDLINWNGLTCEIMYPVCEDVLFWLRYIFYPGIVAKFQKEKGKKILVCSVQFNVILN